MANINLLLFYGVDGDLHFPRLFAGVGIALPLAVLNVLFFIYLYGAVLSRVPSTAVPAFHTSGIGAAFCSLRSTLKRGRSWRTSPSCQTCYAKIRVFEHGKGKVMRAIREKLMQSRWGKLIPPAGALALTTANASSRMPMPGIHLKGDEKRQLTPKEQERQKQLDNDYKAATKKIPEQKTNDPWADVRPAPAVPAQKKQK